MLQQEIRQINDKKDDYARTRLTTSAALPAVLFGDVCLLSHRIVIKINDQVISVRCFSLVIIVETGLFLHEKDRDFIEAVFVVLAN